MIEWGKRYLSRCGIEMVCYRIDGEGLYAYLARKDNGVGFQVHRKTGRHTKSPRFDIIMETTNEKD